MLQALFATKGATDMARLIWTYIFTWFIGWNWRGV